MSNTRVHRCVASCSTKNIAFNTKTGDNFTSEFIIKLLAVWVGRKDVKKYISFSQKNLRFFSISFVNSITTFIQPKFWSNFCKNAEKSVCGVDAIRIDIFLCRSLSAVSCIVLVFVYFSTPHSFRCLCSIFVRHHVSDIFLFDLRAQTICVYFKVQTIRMNHSYFYQSEYDACQRSRYYLDYAPQSLWIYLFDKSPQWPRHVDNKLICKALTGATYSGSHWDTYCSHLMINLYFYCTVAAGTVSISLLPPHFCCCLSVRRNCFEVVEEKK